MYKKIKAEYGLIDGIPVAECTLSIRKKRFIFRGELDEHGNEIYRTFEEALEAGELNNLSEQELEEIERGCEGAFSPFNYLLCHIVGNEFQSLNRWTDLLPDSLNRSSGYIIVNPLSRNIGILPKNHPAFRIVTKMDFLTSTLNQDLPTLRQLSFPNKKSLAHMVAEYGCLVCLGYDFGEKHRDHLDYMLCSLEKNSQKIRDFKLD